MKTNLRASVAQQHIFCFAFSVRRNRSYPNPSVLSMQITCHPVDIHYPARLWMDMKLSCCLHQLWLRGLSVLCSNAVWEWRRCSNKAMWTQSNILYLLPPLLSDGSISIAPCFWCVLWTPASVKAKNLLEPSSAQCINANSQQVCIFTLWNAFIFGYPFHVVNLDCSIWGFRSIHTSCEGLKDETREHINKWCSTSFVLSPQGIWNGCLKRNETDQIQMFISSEAFRLRTLFSQIKDNLFPLWCNSFLRM